MTTTAEKLTTATPAMKRTKPSSTVEMKTTSIHGDSSATSTIKEHVATTTKQPITLTPEFATSQQITPSTRMQYSTSYPDTSAASASKTSLGTQTTVTPLITSSSSASTIQITSKPAQESFPPELIAVIVIFVVMFLVALATVVFLCLVSL